MDPLVKPPYPPRVLAALVRADDDRAVRQVIAALKRAGGSLTGAATELGISRRQLYYWRDSNERLRAAFEAHALGREGAGPNATRLREKRVSLKTPRKPRI